MLFLNALSFNFIQIPKKSLRFRRFRRTYVNQPLWKLRAFLVDMLYSNWTCFFLCSCLSSVMGYLLHLFFVEHTYCSNVVNCEVGKQTKNCEIVIHNLWSLTFEGKHFTSRRKTFSPNSHLVEKATCFPFFSHWYGSNWTTYPYASARI